MKNKFKNAFILASLIAIPTAINYYIFDKSNQQCQKEIENYYKWTFGKIRYTVEGTGDPILLIHDTTPGSGLHEWKNIMRYLSKYNKVYAIDLLGYGFSDKPKISYNAYLYISLINTFIKNVIKEKTTIITSGYSSSFAILANSFESKQINKLIFISPDATSLKEDIEINPIFDKIRRFILESPVLGTSIYNLINSKLGIKSELEDKIINHQQIDSDLVEEYYYSSHNHGASSKYAISSFTSNQLYVDIKNHLNKIKIPVHVIWGDKDYNNPIQNYNYFSELCDDISLTILDDCSSMPHIENPKNFYRTCLSILNTK